jgi:transcriptional regulator with XRE-family HTH domain
MADQKLIQDRLIELKDTFNLRQVDIVEKTGIDKVTISLYFSGNRVPKHENIMLIADAYNVDPAWLMGYDVPMIRNKIISDNEFSDLLDIINSDVDYFKAAIEAISKIPSENKDVVLKMIQAASK